MSGFQRRLFLDFWLFFFTENFSLILIALIVPEGSRLYFFANNFNISFRCLSISITFDPVSCKEQVFTDLPLSASISVTLTIGSKPRLAGLIRELVDSCCTFVLISPFCSCNRQLCFLSLNLD